MGGRPIGQSYLRGRAPSHSEAVGRGSSVGIGVLLEILSVCALRTRVSGAQGERLKFGVVQNQLLEAVPSGSKASSVKSHRKDNRLRLSWSERAGEWETRRLRRRQQRLRSWEQGFKLRSLGSKWSV